MYMYFAWELWFVFERFRSVFKLLSFSCANSNSHPQTTAAVRFPVPLRNSISRDLEWEDFSTTHAYERDTQYHENITIVNNHWWTRISWTVMIQIQPAWFDCTTIYTYNAHVKQATPNRKQTVAVVVVNAKAAFALSACRSCSFLSSMAFSSGCARQNADRKVLRSSTGSK